MIWRVLKKTASDVWDELLYVIVFNFIWIVGTLLIVTWPFVTFGLFYTAKDIGDGKGIKFKRFFSYGREHLKPAYIWGGINLGVLLLLLLNLNFYAGIGTQWASVMQLFFLALTLMWGMLQLITLALYPRLLEPSFRLALRNALVVTGRYPVMILVLLSVVILMVVLSVIFNAVVFILPFSVVAVTTNNVVDAVLKREGQRQHEVDD